MKEKNQLNIQKNSLFHAKCRPSQVGILHEICYFVK
jgi:hypothetical protein